jgi:two-component system sensor histidine kinase YesM
MWFVPFLLITIALIGGFSYYIASNQVLSKISQAQNDVAQKNITQLNYIAQDAIDFTNYLFLSPTVQELLSSENTLVTSQRAFSSLTSLMVTKHTVQSLIIYRMDEAHPSKPFAINQTGVTSAMPFKQFKETTIYKQALEAAGQPTWSLLRPEKGLFVGDKKNKIILSKVISNINTLKKQGIVVVGINEEKLRNHLKSKDTETEMLILDQNGSVLTATDRNWIGKTYTELPYFQTLPYHSIHQLPAYLNSDKWIVSHAQSDLTGWHTVVLQPKTQLLQELDRISHITLAFMALCFFLSVFLSWYAASELTRPLQKLSRSMKHLQTGDFAQRVQFAGQDEIGQLGQGYDTMVQRMKELIDDVYSSKLKQREAELKTLYAQIHPHFLYNTLNTICWTAQQKGEEDIANMTYSLSQVFRLILNDGKDFTTLDKEIELVKNYLYLQQIRFNPRFTFEIHIDEAMHRLHIPKLLLQPLVENSIIHGIEPLKGHGFISITAYPTDHGAMIEIMDNGVGMSAERLEQIQSFRPSPDSSEMGQNRETEQTNVSLRIGFALTNIKERITLAFGEKAELNMRSAEGRGTRVEIYIPLTKEV